MDTDKTQMDQLEVDPAEDKPFLYKQTTEKIIGAPFEVHRELGYGFLERVYQRALQVELLRKGLPTDEAQPLNELKATGLKVGLLINFSRTKVEYKRLVF